MSLQIETFTNPKAPVAVGPRNPAGGASLFKALGHPLAAEAANALIQRLRQAGPLAIFDPDGIVDSFAALYSLKDCDIRGVFVQRLERLGQPVLGQQARLVGDIGAVGAQCIFAVVFDASRRLEQIRLLLSPTVPVLSLDEIRLPAEMLGNRKNYLDPLNFATNFAFMRDQGGLHTRIVTANYWAGYGAGRPALWLCQFDSAGRALARWTEPVPPGAASLVIDSRAIRERFGLGDFCGSLFMHVIGAKGHDVVKYALDTYSDDGSQLSCTHDANAWPADLYGGLPAPDAGEQVTLWVQNSHPAAIPAGSIGLNLMGSQAIARLQQEIPPFGALALDVADLLPEAHWPAQIEVQAGRYFVRPRYEIQDRMGRRRVAHANVERTDLVADPALPALGRHLGKGYIMPLPVLPLDRFASFALPTPMTTCQHELPLAVRLYDPQGRQVATQVFGRIQRRDSALLDVDAWLREAATDLPGGYGHLEYGYDFSDGGEADGWLHAIGRYRLRSSGHTAETSFGAHIYNTAEVYRDEPQSYAGPPPGLTTRLFLRLGNGALDTFCHLIYPASLPWAHFSSTYLHLHDRHGRQIASRQRAIACSGSLHWRYHDIFDAAERAEAGDDAYIIVRDTTCRLFGYHGLVRADHAFSLDHMFGF